MCQLGGRASLQHSKRASLQYEDHEENWIERLGSAARSFRLCLAPAVLSRTQERGL